MPYAPGIYNQGGQFMFEGLRQAGNNAWSLLQHINRQAELRAEEEKKLQDDAKFADMLRRRMPGQFEPADEVWKNLGARDKVAAGQAAIQSLTMEAQKAAVDKAKSESVSDSALAGFAGTFADTSTVQSPGKSTANWGTIPTTERPAMIDDRLMAALGANPDALRSQHAPALLRALADIGQIQANQPPFAASDIGVPRPIPGYNGQAVLPISRHQATTITARPTAETMPDAPPGYNVVPNEKGGFSYLPMKPEAVQADTKMREQAAAQYKKLIAKRDAMQAKMDSGDERTGIDAFGWGTDRRTAMQGIQADIAALVQSNPWLEQESFGKFAEGDFLRGRDGQTYRVVNGKPVLWTQQNSR